MSSGVETRVETIDTSTSVVDRYEHGEGLLLRIILLLLIKSRTGVHQINPDLNGEGEVEGE